MNKIGIIYLFMILVILSCEKDAIESNNDSKIKFGNYSKMLVQSHDTLIIGGYNEIASYDLDINSDNSYDFRLTSEIFGSPGMGQYPQTKILSLNSNCLINGHLLNDTTFYHSQIDTSYGENWSPVYISYTSSYSCQRIDIYDSIISIQPERFNISYFNSEESILRSDYYIADTLRLSDELYADIDFPIIKNDTIIYNYIYYHSTCNSIPNDMIMYIGIKIKSMNDEKIGWIKLGVINDFKVLILETAIQK